MLEQIGCLQLDVTDSDGIIRVVASILEQFGKIDVLVNNAGFAVGKLDTKITEHP